MIEHVCFQGKVIAIILRAEFSQPGVTFLTAPDCGQQLGFLSHPAGHDIAPHVHPPVMRQIYSTSEVLILRKGHLRVDFYDPQQTYVESRILNPGDVIQLLSGGHGFHTLDEVEVIEVKQGPYLGELDKIHFATTPFTQNTQTVMEQTP